ncbi:MAG: hypothetical protein CL861_01610, partial [Cyanobium sp. MED843]
CGGTTTKAIELTITAVDDAAVITGETSGSGSEDNVISGDLNATDVDGLTDDTYFTVSTNPSNGSATIAANTGAWSYTPTLNFNGFDVFTVTITDDLGGTTTKAIELTITAVDDAAVITGDITGSVTENSSKDTVTGTVNITDIDANQPPRFSDVPLKPTAKGYGSYFVSSSHRYTAGTWSYTLNNANDTFDALSTGETLTDSFKLTANDGSTQVITIIIDGADEVAGIDVHRFYNQTNGAHFYTSSTAEKDNIITYLG